MSAPAKPPRLLWVLALALLLLPGCRPRLSFPYTLRPASTGPAGFATQDVLFKLPGGRTERLLTTVENDGSKVSVVVSTPLGQTLFILTWADGPAQVDARVPLPAELDPTLLGALIQLSEWPLEEARKGLPPGWELLESGGNRTLRKGGGVLLVLDREGTSPPWNRVLLRFPRFGVEAEITTLDH